MMFEVRIPQLITSSPNGPHQHWAVKAKRVKREREATRLLLGGRARPAFPLTVTMIRQAPRALDDDNAVRSFKGVRDEIAAWLGLPNDRDPRVKWRVDQEKVTRKNAGTLLRFE